LSAFSLFFSCRSRHTCPLRDWSSAVSSSDPFTTLGTSPTPSPSPSPSPSPTPSPGPIPPAASGLYGSAVTMDGLGNTQIGGPNGSPGRLVAQRFRASTSAALLGVRITLPNIAVGYWGGTGGTLNVSV